MSMLDIVPLFITLIIINLKYLSSKLMGLNIERIESLFRNTVYVYKVRISRFKILTTIFGKELLVSSMY